MASILTTLAAVVCAYRVMRASRLLNVTIWLAGVSALTSVQLFLLGAPEVAVIELSVGAGLVTVLFVFAFSITGEITVDDLTLIPRPLAILLAVAAVLLVGWLALPIVTQPATGQATTFAALLWQQRGLDVLAQVVLIFAGVMGLLGLLADTRTSARERASVMGNIRQRPDAPVEPVPARPSVLEAETEENKR